jgi:3-hydroxyisobutyrate dehydrogenase-like beta-hydroxyacid dehydrogenase
MKRIAILSVGAMSSRIAANLINAGYQVNLYNRTKEKAIPLVKLGAQYYSTPCEAIQNCDVVISLTKDDLASHSIWLADDSGAINGLTKDQIAIECSTLSVEWAQKLATRLQVVVPFLVAPIVGTLPNVEQKTITFLVGGEAKILTEVESVLRDAGGATILNIGSISQAMAMKLTVNSLLGIQVAALAEALGMLGQYGISKNQAMDFLSNLPTLSPAAKGYGNLMKLDNHTPLFPVDLAEKDFGYILEISPSAPLAKATQEVLRLAIEHGYGGDNISALIELYK